MVETVLTRDEILARIRTGTLAARDDVGGVIVFGSFARGTHYHDVDVLVVLKHLEPGREARTRALHTLRDAIGLDKVEIIPYSLTNLRTGLANHFPFLLDVAFDGLVIYEDDGISRLLEQTRQEVTRRGIRRTDTGGWQFPVAYRAETLLSPISNREIAEQWLRDADRDLKVAKTILDVDIYDKCITHCQQTTEKAVKAVLACFGIFERTHYVAGVLLKHLQQQDVADWEERLNRLAMIARRREADAVRSRYIDDTGEELWIPAERYDRSQALAALDDGQTALVLARNFVDWWFTPGQEQEATVSSDNSES
jgi:HEPN domain-containing protein/predicted nucleotidyltransferase